MIATEMTVMMTPRPRVALRVYPENVPPGRRASWAARVAIATTILCSWESVCASLCVHASQGRGW